MVTDIDRWNRESFQMDLMKPWGERSEVTGGRKIGCCKNIRSPTVMKYLRSTASFSHVAGCAWIASTNIKSWFLKAITSKSPQRYDPSVAHSMWSEPAVHDIWFNFIIRKSIVRLDNKVGVKHVMCRLSPSRKKRYRREKSLRWWRISQRSFATATFVYLVRQVILVCIGLTGVSLKVTDLIKQLHLFDHLRFSRIENTELIAVIAHRYVRTVRGPRCVNIIRRTGNFRCWSRCADIP